MHTIVISLGFQKKVKGKYDSEYIDSIIEKLSFNPRIGKKFEAVNNVFKFDLGFTTNKKSEYSILYIYQGKSQPLFIVNIFRKKEKDLLSKVINSLVDETKLE